MTPDSGSKDREKSSLFSGSASLQATLRDEYTGNRKILVSYLSSKPYAVTMTFTDLPPFLKNPPSSKATSSVAGRASSRSSTPLPDGDPNEPTAPSHGPDDELSDSEIQGLAFPVKGKTKLEPKGSLKSSRSSKKDDSKKAASLKDAFIDPTLLSDDPPPVSQDDDDDGSKKTLDEDVVPKETPDEAVTPSDTPSAPPRRFELYFADGFPPSDDDAFASMVEYAAKIDPVDWCDSFANPFHISLACDNEIWNRLCASFVRLSTAEDLHVWLSSKIKSSSLAFLGASRSGRPLVLHNVFSPEDCGTLVNPTLTFYALDRKTFDSPPFEIPQEDMAKIIHPSIHRNVPTFEEIIAHCVKAHDPPLADDLPNFFFDPENFKTLSPASPSKRDQDHSFSSSSWCPIPPAIAGLIVKNFDPSEFDRDESCGAFASDLYKFASYHWWSSNQVDSPKPKDKTVPLDCPFFAIQAPLFRFLWLLEHKRSSLTVTHPSLPKDLSRALDCLSHRNTNRFPTLFVESPTPKRSNVPTKHSKHHSSSADVPSSHSQSTTQDIPIATPSPPVDCSSPPSGVRMLDDDGNVHFVSPEMFLLSKCIKEVTTKKNSNEDDITAPESKSMFRDMPLHAQKHLRLNVINRSSTSLPDDLSDIVKTVWKSKNSSTFFESFVAEVFEPADNACTILLGQCAVIQRLGLRWKSEASPGGFSPFSFDPYAIPGIDSTHTLDKNIRQQIHDASLCHLNDMEQSKEMQKLYTNHSLFFPRTEDEFEKQLRLFWSCAKGLTGSLSFISSQILKVLNFFHENRYRVIAKMQSSGNDFYFGQILFALDECVQEFVASLSKAQCIEDVGFDNMEERVNWLLFSIKTGSPLGGLPAALQAKFQAQQQKLNSKKRSNPSDDSSNSNSKKQNQANSSPSIPKNADTFDTPANWKLPKNKAYAKIFPASVISKIPTVEKNGETIPFCNVLFSKGWCKKGKKCNYCHDDPSKHNKKDEMDTYFREAYEAS